MSEMTVPMNIREEFDTSEINVGMNNVEEVLKEKQLLEDNPYIPTPDERTLNVVEVIKETSTYYDEEVGHAVKDTRN